MIHPKSAKISLVLVHTGYAITYVFQEGPLRALPAGIEFLNTCRHDLPLHYTSVLRKLNVESLEIYRGRVQEVDLKIFQNTLYTHQDSREKKSTSG